MSKSNQVNDKLNMKYCTVIATLLLLVQSCFIFLSQEVAANRLVAESMAAYGSAQSQDLKEAMRPIGSVGPNYLRRIQRSSESTLADMLNIPRQVQTRGLQSETRKQLNNQLSDLLNKAANDKSLEKALLNALFQQQQQQIQQQQLQQQQPFDNIPESGRELILLNERSSFEPNQQSQMNFLRQADLANMAAKLAAFSDQAYLNANDISSNELGPSDYATNDLVQLQAMPKKRTMLPCNFNAISCAKNPYGKLKIA